MKSTFLLIVIFTSFWFVFRSDIIANNSDIIDIRISYENLLSQIANINDFFATIINKISPSEIMVKSRLSSSEGYLYRINGLMFKQFFLDSDDNLHIILIDSHGYIYKFELLSSTEKISNMMSRGLFVEYNKKTNISKIKNVVFTQNELGDFYSNELNSATYFNVYWKDRRSLKEINNYFNSKNYDFKNSSIINVERIILFN